jgi:hypothetical protein
VPHNWSQALRRLGGGYYPEDPPEAAKLPCRGFERVKIGLCAMVAGVRTFRTINYEPNLGRRRGRRRAGLTREQRFAESGAIARAERLAAALPPSVEDTVDQPVMWSSDPGVLRHAKHVRRVVDSLPPLTAEQRARLAVLLHGGATTG